MSDEQANSFVDSANTGPYATRGGGGGGGGAAGVTITVDQ
jgi:hypothetical protein